MNRQTNMTISKVAVAVVIAVFTAAAFGVTPAFAEGFLRGHDHAAQAASGQVITLASSSASKSVGALRGGETRPTMSPANFTGYTAVSYRIASQIPDVLDSLHCYCDCKRHSGHKSLLTCYVDEHAAYCGICQDEAFMAYEMHMKGMSAKAIRETVDKKYSNMKD